MGEVAEEEEEAGGRVPLEPPERRRLLVPEAAWLEPEAGGRALDLVVLVLAAERAVVAAAAAGAGALGLAVLVVPELGAAFAGWLVGAGEGLALLTSPAPPEAADLPVDRLVGVAMAGRGGTGTG